METPKIKHNDSRYEKNMYQGFIDWAEMRTLRANYCSFCKSKPNCQTFSKFNSAINTQTSYWNPNCFVALRRIRAERGLPAKIITCSDFKPLDS